MLQSRRSMSDGRIDVTETENPMFKPLLIAALLAAPLCAWAAEDKAKTPRQETMASCNKQAGDRGLKGDDRKKYLSECLSAARSQARTGQQGKMKSCNKEAADKALKGDERKTFMAQCLKGQSKT
jgi:hypothetical protein